MRVRLYELLLQNCDNTVPLQSGGRVTASVYIYIYIYMRVKLYKLLFQNCDNTVPLQSGGRVTASVCIYIYIYHICIHACEAV